MMSLNVAVIDDAGFGSNRSSLFGKELYIELLTQINREILGNNVVKIELGGLTSTGDIVIHGSNKRVIRVFKDRELEQQLYEALRYFKINLIHVNVLNARYPRPVVRVAKRLGIPIVVTIHSWAYVCPTGWAVKLPNPTPCKAGLQLRCIKCLWHHTRLKNKNKMWRMLDGFNQYNALKHLLKNSNAIISPSKQLAEALKKIHSIEKVHVIHNPAPPHMLEQKPQYGGDKAVAFFARLSWEKGVHLIPEIAKRISNIEIHVMGKGPLETLIRYSSRKYRNIVFHGFVPEKDKIRIVKKASVTVMPIVWREAFGYTVVEAFSLGKPVVGFALGGVKELIENSQAGYIAEPYNLEDISEKILKAIEHSCRLGARGRMFVEKQLNQDTYGIILSKIYSEIVQES